MEIKLENLTPIKKRRETTSEIKINTSGLYITRDAGINYKLHECSHAVLFEHDDDSFILIGYKNTEEVPHTLRTNMYNIQTSKDQHGNVNAYKVYCTEIKRKYSKGNAVVSLEANEITVSGMYALMLKAIARHD